MRCGGKGCGSGAGPPGVSGLRSSLGQGAWRCCAIVASDTRPVQEAIRHGDTGRLVDFFDAAGLANEVCDLLADPGERERLGARARAFAQEHYDLHAVCLPRQMQWVRELAA